MRMYRTNLGDFLRARRDACQPEDVGIDRERHRRVAGLRRDEVAALAGMSTEYYVRLEQGRVDSPSRQVLDALARALRLSTVSTDYLYRLAGLGAPRVASIAPQSRDAMNSVLRRWRYTPAYIMDCNLDVVAANDLMIAVSRGEVRPGVNAVELTFSTDRQVVLEDWERTARETVATFRYLTDDTSRRHHEILEKVSDDPDFARFWKLHEVNLPTNYEVRADVEGLGELCVDVQNLTLPDFHGHTVTLYTAEEGSFTDEVLRQLAGSLEVAA
ncbi:helix-turn-helix domain-containing protein [Microbacterium sp. SLBN-146]|uniref:helix-turn-helix domain-containing protein n=1 Tax=Microbacterium sp. SLBN-146 TaxID=2768457 RepID=UPI001174DBF3|nr:helix-turn-helix transcriptional regulator [Microbacterium sp. SLBN-146]TQJ30012.1 helix-turn-helix protein [Microbacterium sp. SLBN-146]